MFAGSNKRGSFVAVDFSVVVADTLDMFNITGPAKALRRISVAA